jgi:hypothetical protein
MFSIEIEKVNDKIAGVIISYSEGDIKLDFEIGPEFTAKPEHMFIGSKDEPQSYGFGSGESGYFFFAYDIDSIAIGISNSDMIEQRKITFDNPTALTKSYFRRIIRDWKFA